MSYSRYITPQGHIYQFKTGDDNYEDFALGNAVPYMRNPDLALDEKWPDQVVDGVLEKDWPGVDQHIWIVIKDHHIVEAARMKFGFGATSRVKRRRLERQYGIKPATEEEWSDAARIAYHREQAKSELRTARFIAENGTGPGAFMRSRLKEKGFLRRILPPLSLDPEVDQPGILRTLMGAQGSDRSLVFYSDAAGLAPVTKIENGGFYYRPEGEVEDFHMEFEDHPGRRFTFEVYEEVGRMTVRAIDPPKP